MELLLKLLGYLEDVRNFINVKLILQAQPFL